VVKILHINYFPSFVTNSLSLSISFLSFLSSFSSLSFFFFTSTPNLITLASRAWMPQFGLTPILKLRVDKGGSTYDLNDLKYAKLNSENVQNIDKENYDLASLAVPLQEAFS